ncbi:M24 family metallopeptidase [Lactiplantibacillus mudanjiangensis]|uniref:Xaa-Pro aminopeptidase [Lactobacillus paraplantarum] n=1 Tax=Lactiplantibacillus mudanjiangensis TaxID=1296538 RepID=A0A660E377_9LACO|nr:aminopeptidase P family protein [Lactiplantibacillus mudanjiangensis]VDG19823.1 Xaa-Pro aminopeptidase [Lactobacillus paraplantarum] [Lactiplantibacillus mudanjiangensis]VDG24496.1 Xaa-Pro aminopeptidase [Lactobacillus paraplantarum] [Lactiplantibacillus mudanjiangensis]VDG29787.1 Xaa-Pro aminopeptidase [Lactobacillus paraplantarum] [Lactiplantibacillus mudanjiangensis]VDG31249.1 Xaa-Pro aminopeptidase [Lactobacillus paraplantarum] [Lactiplantibacillus mudanjiangensis]
MSERIARVQQTFDQLKIDALLVSSASDLQYLTGMADMAGDGYLLVLNDSVYLITDARYQTAFASQYDAQHLLITRDYLGAVCDVIAQTNTGVMGFDAEIPYAAYSYLDENLTSDLVALPEVVADLRIEKSEAEIAKLRATAKLADAGFEYVTSIVRPGMREIDVSNLLDAFMRTHGASGPSFTTIVLGGARAALPHGTASDAVLQAGQMVTLDFGYFLNDYTSDMTRTFALGEPDAKLKAAYQVVQDAQQAVVDQVKPGAVSADLDQVGRELITQAGYGDAFNHGMGHGIGLAIHEGPLISKRGTETLIANSVVTVEPGVYFPGLGGMRIEDDVLVTATGHERLTMATRNLLIL